MAALWVSSRRLPGITQRNVLPISSVPWGGYNRTIELPHLETFPGAACYQPIELPGYKAAPLQAFAPLNTRPVCNPSGFIPHFSNTRTSTACPPYPSLYNAAARGRDNFLPRKRKVRELEPHSWRTTKSFPPRDENSSQRVIDRARDVLNCWFWAL